MIITPLHLTKELQRAIHNEPSNCVLLVGAGLSASSVRKGGEGLPDWDVLMQHMIQDLRDSHKCDDNVLEKLEGLLRKGKHLEIARVFKERTRHDQFAAFLKAELDPPDLVPSKVHQLILQSKLRGIITTNFDMVFESQGFVVRPLVYPYFLDEPSVIRGDNFFIKIHGCIRNTPKIAENLILTQESYVALRLNQKYRTILHSLFLLHPILAVGFSLRDPDLLGLIDDLRGIFEDEFPTIYALMLEPGVEARDHWRTRGVEIIPYETHSELLEFFEEMRDLSSQKSPVSTILSISAELGVKSASSEKERNSPHVTDRLQERDRLVELIAQLPDPDDILARWEEFVPDSDWLDQEVAIWPGCLYKDEEGEGYSGAFSLLFEHTREDPHWAVFDLTRDPEPTLDSINARIANGSLPWTTAYEFFYMGKLLYLVGGSHWFYQDRVYSVCKAIGNSSPMIDFPAFVMRPIRDAVRMHLGKGPLPRADYKLEYINPSPGARPYNLRFGNVLIAKGIDQREKAQDNAVADAVAAVHNEFRERIMHANEPRDIVSMWHRLKADGQKLIEWLNSFTATDIERGSCRGCPSISGLPVMPEFAKHIRDFLEGSPTTPPTEEEKIGQTKASAIPRRRTKFSSTKIIIERTVSLQPGERVKIAELHVGDQFESYPETKQGDSSEWPHPEEKEKFKGAIRKAVREFTGPWAVVISAHRDPANAESIYEIGLKEFPSDKYLIGSYANFLYDVRKDYDKAEELYKKAIEIDPNYGINLGNYATLLYKVHKNYDKAETLYTKAIEIRSINAITLANYANFLYDVRKDYDKAEELYKKAIEIDPNYAVSLSNYANLLYSVRRKYDKAEELYRRAINIDPNDAGNMGNYANFLHNTRRDYDKAEELYKKAIEIDPKNSASLVGYANLLYSVRKRYDKALNIYKEIMEIDPNNIMNLSSYANFLCDVDNDYDKAEAFFKRAMAIDPNNIVNLGNYANFLHDAREDFDRAEELYLKIMEIAPNYAVNLGNYANFLCNVRKDYDKAGELYKKAIELDPKDLAANLGNYANLVNVARKDYDKAEELYKKAIELDPNNAIKLGNYATFLYTVRKDYDKAEEFYKRAITAAPDYAIHLSNYANFLYVIRKNYDKAEEYYKKVVRIEPNNSTCLTIYANLLWTIRKDYDKAEGLYKQAASIDPNNAGPLGDYASFLCHVRNDYDKAADIYRRAITIDPHNSNNLSAYALFLSNIREDYTKAEDLFIQALNINPKDCNIMCNYGGFLLAMGKNDRGYDFMINVSHSCLDSPVIYLEYSFYLYAHHGDEAVRKENLAQVKNLLMSDVRSRFFDLSMNVARAVKDKHPHPKLLAVLARVIADKDEIKELNRFECWREL